MRDRNDDRMPEASGPRSAEGPPTLVPCFWCERLHPAVHALSVCPPCAAAFSILRSLEMSGPFPLTEGGIDDALTRTSPGNYALGYMDGDAFQVFYVGRSDTDVRRRLHEWVGAPARYEAHASVAKAPWALQHRGLSPLDAPTPGRVGNAGDGYTRFAYSYARSADDAYAHEWRNYDAFGGSHALDNEAQPVATTG